MGPVHPRSSMRDAIVVAALACAVVGPTLAADPAQVADCGNPFVNAYGPFDYRTATLDQKKIVETYHFTSAVESLRAGITGSIGAEIDYTLRAFPNHPRALMAMVRLGQKEKVAKPVGAQYSVECYLARAFQFQPDDVNVRQVRGIYASMQGQTRQAIDDFKAVIARQPENANAHYNLGLAYFDAKEYDLALQEAKAASTLGFPLEGLQRKLKAAGKWQD